MNGERFYGSADSRQLHVRWLLPDEFCTWQSYRQQFRLLKMLSPVCWWKAMRNKWNWECWFRSYPEMNHRCYCSNPRDWSFDGHVRLAGFGIIWWYSFYSGPVPCTCDEVIEEMFPSVKE